MKHVKYIKWLCYSTVCLVAVLGCKSTESKPGEKHSVSSPLMRLDSIYGRMDGNYLLFAVRVNGSGAASFGEYNHVAIFGYAGKESNRSLDLVEMVVQQKADTALHRLDMLNRVEVKKGKDRNLEAWVRPKTKKGVETLTLLLEGETFIFKGKSGEYEFVKHPDFRVFNSFKEVNLDGIGK